MVTEMKLKIDLMTQAVLEELNEMNWSEEPVAVLRTVKKYMFETEELVCTDAYKIEQYNDIEAPLNHWLIDCVIETRYPKSNEQHISERMSMRLKQTIGSCIHRYASSLKFIIS